eukprot:4056054-Prorocentrum_lima.AAC.1
MASIDKLKEFSNRKALWMGGCSPRAVSGGFRAGTSWQSTSCRGMCALGFRQWWLNTVGHLRFLVADVL